MKKIKIINIIPSPPPYEAYRNSPRPEVNWDTANGSWVGVWGYDWSDLLGNEILKITDEFDYEVWQTDLRADRVYSHSFKNRLVHKLFPAIKKKKVHGIKIINSVLSPKMMQAIEKITPGNCLLHLNTPGHGINKEILKNFCEIGKIIQFHSKLIVPALEMKRIRPNIFANLSYLNQHYYWMKNKKTFFVYNNAQNFRFLEEYNQVGIDRIFMGCDFNFWVPGDKEILKKHFKVDPNTKVFSMASRFNKLKQIDQIIRTLSEIDMEKDYDFKLMIAGHGEAGYESYLENISSNLIKKQKLYFLGYLSDKDLLKLYQASDLFISASTSEGGPVSVIKAIACGVPVMSTRVRGVDDILSQYQAGILVDKFNYQQWKETFINILSRGNKITLMEREVAKGIFDWPRIASKFVQIYKKVYQFL